MGAGSSRPGLGSACVPPTGAGSLDQLKRGMKQVAYSSDKAAASRARRVRDRGDRSARSDMTGRARAYRSPVTVRTTVPV